MGFLHCFLYLAAMGWLVFIIGRLLPVGLFDANRFPWKSFSWEHDGKIYNKIKIKSWQNKVPDMSKLFTKIMPSKKLTSLRRERVLQMLHETCVAEVAHIALMLLGLGCIGVWEGKGGIIVSILYFVGNIPFILIQRYNRPRLIRLLRGIEAESGAISCSAASTI